MQDKKQLVLRIPTKLWEKLNIMARKEYRSLNGQIEFLLAKSVGEISRGDEIENEEIDGDI